MSHNASFRIVYEDAHILVVDKPAGIAVLPERWERDQVNLLDQLRTRWPDVTTVHRIDKETSGLILMALEAEAARKLQIDFETRRINKFYHAQAFGNPAWDTMVCDSPLIVDGDRLHRSIPCKAGNPEARRCESRFKVLERFRKYTLIEVQLLTGRTHQIRAHAAFLGYPLVGDHLYGGPKELLLSEIKTKWRGDRFDEQPLLNRVGLHAWSIEFMHPIKAEMMQFTTEYPKDLRASLNQLRRL